MLKYKMRPANTNPYLQCLSFVADQKAYTDSDLERTVEPTAREDPKDSKSKRKAENDEIFEHQIKISRLENRCAACSKPFYVTSELMAHIQTCENKAMAKKDTKSNSQDEPLRVRENQCLVCQTIFQSSEYMKVHMTTHQDRNLPFQCIPCSLFFSKRFYQDFCNSSRFFKQIHTMV